MALSISKREENGVTVLTLAGDLGLGQESGSLREAVKKLLAEGKRKIVLNMAAVSLIDGEMTSWYGSRAIAGLDYLAEYTR